MTSIAAVARSHRPSGHIANANLALHVGRVVHGILRRIAAARVRARSTRRLEAFDERALRDIGLTFSQAGRPEPVRRYRPRNLSF